jgi:hypothetical protein
MTAAALVCAAAICAPAASAGTQNPTVVSPDAASMTGQDLRSQDLRSPDARDAADGIVPAQVRTPTAPQVEVVHEISSDGFEWGDAAIGAGVGLLLASGVAATLTARRRRAYRAAVS